VTALVSTDLFSRHAMIGFAFRDASDHALVADGLDIKLADALIPGRSVQLVPTPSGTWMNVRLPGIGMELEGKPEDWAANARTFIVEVEDRLGRFLPARFEAQLPKRGRFVWPSWADFNEARTRPLLPAEPPEGFTPDYLPLFPSIARTPPGPRATVRATIALRQDDGSDSPAAWAAVAVSISNRVVGLGVADAGGAVAVSFPYPDLPSQTVEEAAAGRSIVSWDATIRVYYGALEGDPPDLADILGQLSQTSTPTLATLEPPAAPLPAQSLVLGRPLVAATMRDDSERFSSLYLETA
jgi:hypothetical protein